MTKRPDSLDELTEEEVHEFLGMGMLSPVRRYPPAPDGIKLTLEEARQALNELPRRLLQDKAQRERQLGGALRTKREMARVDFLGHIVLGPNPSQEQLQALQELKGHMFRLGGMNLLTHQAMPMYQAAAAAPARKKRWNTPEQRRRQEIIDCMLANYTRKRGMAPLAHEINKNLERQGRSRSQWDTSISGWGLSV